MPSTSSECVVIRLNLRNTSDINYVDFTSLRRSGLSCQTNDLTISNDGKYLLVTDFVGYQVSDISFYEVC